jgi:hypothetical protein
MQWTMKEMDQWNGMDLSEMEMKWKEWNGMEWNGMEYFLNRCSPAYKGSMIGRGV